MSVFKIVSDFVPRGDQPAAIEDLSAGVEKGQKHQVLMGVTGSGKTYTMANIIERSGKTSLILAPNKTLAAQLFNEFKVLFPENAVEYFVSYYDYYQPEAYIPQTDTYIEKDSSINETIDKMRHSATRSLLERRDVIIIASVSCIYGLGSPEAYQNMLVHLISKAETDRDEVLKKLVEIQYERNDIDFHRGTFRVRGDVVEVFPAYEESVAVRIEFFGDTVDAMYEIDPLRGQVIRALDRAAIYPASHYVTERSRLLQSVDMILDEMKERVEFFRSRNKLIEAQRIEERTRFDMEMLKEMGYCNGIENYSRYLTGRNAGEPPPTLLEYFPKDSLFFIDESHVGMPQVQGMFRGDRSRKQNLVDYGFRLPSALDNRPLTFEEFEGHVSQVIYVSATPGPYELDKAQGRVIQQVIRPTGLMDPVIELRPASDQVDDLLHEIQRNVEKDQRVLVTTLTKKMAEDLTEYYGALGVRVKYLHSEIKTIERMEIIRDLRLGEFDVLIGINLLREGLDIPEVSLVAILDADKEGFLRSQRSLMQTAGRASRNVDGRVILYADVVTESIKKTVDETNRRRVLQMEFNRENNITPETIRKSINDILSSLAEQDYVTIEVEEEEPELSAIPVERISREIEKLTAQMFEAARDLEFEKAAELRDRIRALEQRQIKYGSP
ncbi:MAG TPA: excinuclease ABC subunit UvrB [Desulfomonilaceae bacterium]|nr:excinuclease ABC subunit UvrB [Desulfomonilaceae bacterium]